ncbi:extracellular solute-binding protein [Paenibacillus beijingensis]|uniref:extracellular solute-binding protein n=1 Tax=Paenibacillus beijingensis TaxID=1126833 RepID=UPI0006961B3B|nr:extracellular solute-binding protein [Paenibacillus beijingensis]
MRKKLLDLKSKGYINEDVLTAKRSDMPTRFAQGKVAFIIGGTSFADEVHKVDPNVKVGIMPLTSMVAGDGTNFSGGERYTVGAWKDGKHLEESKKLIAFFAKPENMSRFANATKLPAGLKISRPSMSSPRTMTNSPASAYSHTSTVYICRTECGMSSARRVPPCLPAA